MKNDPTTRGQRWHYVGRTPAHGYIFRKGHRALVLYGKAGGYKTRLGYFQDHSIGAVLTVVHQRISTGSVNYHALAAHQNGSHHR